MPHRSKGPESAVEDLIYLSKTLDRPDGLLPEHENRLDAAFQMMFLGVENVKKKYYVDVLCRVRSRIGDYAAALIAAGGSTAIIALRRKDRDNFVEILCQRKTEIKSEQLRVISDRYIQKYNASERNAPFFYTVDLASFLNDYKEQYPVFKFSTGTNRQLPSIEVSLEVLQDLYIYVMERNKERMKKSLPALQEPRCASAPEHT